MPYNRVILSWHLNYAKLLPGLLLMFSALYDFVNGEMGIKYGVVDNFLYQLRLLESWFERQRFFRFYQSSLVLFYDAIILHKFLIDTPKWTPFSDERNPAVPVKVLMVDFDNVFVDTEDKPDENCLSAIRSLISVFENMSTFRAKSGT